MNTVHNNLKLIGYWITSLKDDKFPPPQELISDYDTVTRQAIADYLDAGSEIAAYRGTSWCRFFCDHPMGHRELTDGQWVWPEGLSHYVRDHHVRLPDEFRASVQFGFPATAPIKNESRLDLPDETFWIAWCNEHRSNSLKSQLQLARRRADAEAHQIIADQVLEREKSEGLSEDTCQWSACNNLALAERSLCAFCLHKENGGILAMEPYMNLQAVLES